MNDYREMFVVLKNGEKYAYEGKMVARSIYDMPKGYGCSLSYHKDERFLYISQTYEDGEHFTYAYNLAEVISYTEKLCITPKEE